METIRVALVRAFGDEPCKLQVAANGSAILVVGDGGESIPYPAAFVYEFEDKLFADLSDAYARGDMEHLTSLWRRARPVSHQSFHH